MVSPWVGSIPVSAVDLRLDHLVGAVLEPRLQLSLVRNSGSGLGASRPEGTRSLSISSMTSAHSLGDRNSRTTKMSRPWAGSLKALGVVQQPLADDRRRSASGRARRDRRSSRACSLDRLAPNHDIVDMLQRAHVAQGVAARPRSGRRNSRARSGRPLFPCRAAEPRRWSPTRSPRPGSFPPGRPARRAPAALRPCSNTAASVPNTTGTPAARAALAALPTSSRVSRTFSSTTGV